MSRASIALTEPNEIWVASMVEREEYSSKTELINDLVRRARRADQEREYIRSQLIQAEQNGISERSLDQIRAAAIARLKLDGEI